MIFSDVFERFIAESPMAVMVRAVLERLLPAPQIDRLFHEHAHTQYTKELLFSSCVKCLCLVVCRMFKTVGAAYKKHAAEFGVSLKNVYAKMKKAEPAVLQALVRHSATEAAAALHALQPSLTANLPGYSLRILDGNHLAATQKRLKGLRGHSAAPLPGQSLVIYDPDVDLIMEVILHRDAHAQERALLDQIIPLVQAKEVWIGDRNFCVIDFLQAIQDKDAYFVIRHHAQVSLQGQAEYSEGVTTATGTVSERRVVLGRENHALLATRCLRIQLKTSTAGGDDEIILLTNLPTIVSAEIIASLYLMRWTIEHMFQELTVNLRCEIDTLAYPPAALFGFAMALMMYNVLSTAKGALSAAHGREKITEEFSGYYLVDELAGEYRGMMIALPPESWRLVEALTFPEFIDFLKRIAQGVRLERYKKSPRSPKKPTRRLADGKPHVATARILDEQKKYIK